MDHNIFPRPTFSTLDDFLHDTHTHLLHFYSLHINLFAHSGSGPHHCIHPLLKTLHKPSHAPWHKVAPSGLHGTGVYAARDIAEGTRIIDYGGRRITTEQADAKPPTNPDQPFHTFFFALSSGKIIDGGSRGNDARWINHCCAPNCEAQENEAGTRVHIVALRNIAKDEELFYDYGLVMDGRITKKLKQQYQCLCGAANCRGTMLALPKQSSQRPSGQTKR